MSFSIANIGNNYHSRNSSASKISISSEIFIVSLTDIKSVHNHSFLSLPNVNSTLTLSPYISTHLLSFTYILPTFTSLSPYTIDTLCNVALDTFSITMAINSNFIISLSSTQSNLLCRSFLHTHSNLATTPLPSLYATNH